MWSKHFDIGYNLSHSLPCIWCVLVFYSYFLRLSSTLLLTSMPERTRVLVVLWELCNSTVLSFIHTYPPSVNSSSCFTTRRMQIERYSSLHPPSFLILSFGHITYIAFLFLQLSLLLLPLSSPKSTPKTRDSPFLEEDEAAADPLMPSSHAAVWLLLSTPLSFQDEGERRRSIKRGVNRDSELKIDGNIDGDESNELSNSLLWGDNDVPHFISIPSIIWTSYKHTLFESGCLLFFPFVSESSVSASISSDEGREREFNRMRTKL